MKTEYRTSEMIDAIRLTLSVAELKDLRCDLHAAKDYCEADGDALEPLSYGILADLAAAEEAADAWNDEENVVEVDGSPDDFVGVVKSVFGYDPAEYEEQMRDIEADAALEEMKARQEKVDMDNDIAEMQERAKALAEEAEMERFSKHWLAQIAKFEESGAAQRARNREEFAARYPRPEPSVVWADEDYARVDEENAGIFRGFKK